MSSVEIIAITGATGEIGHTAAKHFHSIGKRLLLIDLNTDNVQKSFPPEDKNVLTVKADISKEEDVKNAIEKGVERFGRIDGVIHCAAVFLPATVPFAEETPERWFKTHSVNAFGTFNVDRYFIRQFLSQTEKGHSPPKGGYSIVNLSSGLASQAVPGTGLYSSTKGAIESMTRSIAVEYASKNIRANCVAPGPISTPFFYGTGLNSDIAADGIWMKRLGNPDELVGIFELLLGDKGSFMTGTVYPISGGVSHG